MGRAVSSEKFCVLRQALEWHGVSQRELAEAWNAAHPENTRLKYQAWISDLLTGKRQWKLAEMYFVLDYLNIPHSQLHIYFPPNGVAENKKYGGYHNEESEV